MSKANYSSPFMHSGASVSTMMFLLCVALIPGMAVYSYFFGPGVIINVILASIFALSFETAVLKLRGKAIVHNLLDGSALVTALLFALALPPNLPWWINLIGIGFAIIIVKHLYGGLGHNIFNPAMTGYALLLISYPKEMATWFPPLTSADSPLNLTFTWNSIFSPHSVENIDTLTQATPLDELGIQTDLGGRVPEIMQQELFGNFGASAWEWISIAFLLGGLFLIYKKVISWHIPVSVLGSLFVISGIFYLVNDLRYPSPLFHLVSGATMLGAFFIATDPVTSSTTTLGKIIFGIGVGMLIFIIRAWGGYPDSIAFAVLIMNMFAPLIDQYTIPKIYGQKEDKS